MPGLSTRLVRCFLTLMLTMFASSAFAHEGHGDPQHPTGLMHYLVNPTHAIWIVTAAFVLAIGLRYSRRWSRAQSEGAASEKRSTGT